MLMMVDIQIFENNNDNPVVEEICEAIFVGAPSTLITETTLNDLKEIKDKGDPYPANMFSKVKEEIFKAMHNEDYSDFVENCALASIYSKRRWDDGLSLPHEVFDRLVKEIEAKDWKVKLNNDDISIYKRKLPSSNIVYKDDSIVKAPIELIADLLFLRRAEYDKGIISMNVLEKINNDTFICHILAKNFIPLAKKRDLVILICRKKTKSGNVMVLFTSCDHKDAPETNEYIRLKVKLIGNLCIPLSSTLTRCVGVVEATDPGKLPEIVKQGMVMVNRSLTRIKALKECSEKLYQSK